MKVYSLNPKDKGWKVINNSESVSSPEDADLLYLTFPKFKFKGSLTTKENLESCPEHQIIVNLIRQFPQKIIFINGDALYSFYSTFFNTDRVMSTGLRGCEKITVADPGVIIAEDRIVPVAQFPGTYTYVGCGVRTIDNKKIKPLVCQRRQDLILYLAKHNNVLLGYVNLELMAKVPNQEFLKYLNKVIAEWKR